MRFFSSAQSRPPTAEHRGNAPNADAVPAPTTHQPPPWLGSLLLISLLVMLNTHLFVTLAAGIDQYSLYAADSSVRQPYPAGLAQSPYPALLSFLFNVLLAFIAYAIYRLIWRHFVAASKTNPDEPVRNPFKLNAIALAIPVFIAMAPSLVLGYTNLKPYFVIVGALIAIVLCIVGALKDPDVNLDLSTRGYWFNVAVAATFVMMTLAVVVTLYFQIAPVEPPSNNLLWQLEWIPYPLEGFEQRLRGGMLLFGLSSLAYMVAVLGGVLLATLHPPRIDPRSKEQPSPTAATLKASGPEPLRGAGSPIVNVPVSNVPVRVTTLPPQAEPQPEPEPQQGAGLPIFNIQVINMAEGGRVYPTQMEPQTEGDSPGPTPAPHPRVGLPDEGSPGPDPESQQRTDLPEEEYPTPEPLHGDVKPVVNLPVDGTAEQWAKEFLTQLENLPLEGRQDSSYLVVVSTGLEMRISEGQYMILVDERSGFLAGVDLFVDRWTRTVKTKSKVDSTFGSPNVNTHPKNARYIAVCLFCQMPHRRFRTPQLQTLLSHETGEPVANMSDLLAALRGWNVPLTSVSRETFIRDDAKTVYVERVRTNSTAGSDARTARPLQGEAAGP